MKPTSLLTPSALAAWALALSLAPAAAASGSSLSALDAKARAAAAAATASSHANACADARPFYWEIGDARLPLARGSVRDPDTTSVVSDRTPMLWASATKWIYSAYVVQRKAGQLTHTDIQMLTMRSGFANLSSCRSDQTVDSCLAYRDNGAYRAELDGRFAYDGGHMQVHASMNGLGAMTGPALASEMRRQLGNDIGLAFTQPQLAGGAAGTPASYARFLRKLLDGRLVMGTMLGRNAVCAGGGAAAGGCDQSEVARSPAPGDETPHYALGHWVEDDPRIGDGAFSSPGAFGFYPWIDASRTYYGMVARQTPDGGYGSLQCGRLIRQAWSDGQPR